MLVVVASVTRGDMPVYLRGLRLGNCAQHRCWSRVAWTAKSPVSPSPRGQFVKAGDLLVQIDPRPYQVQLEWAEGQLAKDEVALADIKVNYERYKALYQDQGHPQAAVDTQLSQVGVFEGSIASDKAQINNAKLQLVYCKITEQTRLRGIAVAGRSRQYRPRYRYHWDAGDHADGADFGALQPASGQLAGCLQEAARQSGLERRSVESRQFQQDRHREVANHRQPNRSDDGHLSGLKAVFDNDDFGLFPNQFVNIRLLLDTRHGLSVIPAAAVQRDLKVTMLYLVEDKKARVHPVTVALHGKAIPSASPKVSRLAYIVVTDGQDKLQDTTPVDATSLKSNKGTKAE